MNGFEGFVATSYGEAIADVYDELFTPDDFDMYGPSETDDTVGFLAALVPGGGPALEVGAGTGRVALALARRGIDVTAVEISAAMLRRLSAKQGSADLAVLHGDFLTVPLERRFRLIYIVFNTLIAFTSQEGQMAFFRRAAQLLTEDGKLVIENAVPPDRGAPGLVLRRLAPDYVLADAFSYDPSSQIAVKQHILLRGGGMRLFPLTTRHVWPSEMDLMARLAGLRLQSRHGGWHNEHFVASSKRHISTYTFLDA